MISVQDYFGKPHTQEQFTNAVNLLERVNALAEEAIAAGAFTWQVDPDTNCSISGRAGGDGDGGFRTPGTRTGRMDRSGRAVLGPDGKLLTSHGNGEGVDPFDPEDRLDHWLDGFEHGQGGNTMLEKHGLYREHPETTPNWCHLTTRPPKSGHRTFRP